MRDRLPFIGDPSAKLVWVGSGPSKSAELDALFNSLSKHHEKNGTLLKLIRPIYEEHFPTTEIGKKAIELKNNQFEKARANAIQEAVKPDGLHLPALRKQAQNYEKVKANFKSAWLEYISARPPKNNFDQDVLPALKIFTGAVLETEEAVAPFEDGQNKLRQDKLSANAMGLRQNFKKELHKARVSVNASNFEKHVKDLAKNYRKQLDEELNKLVSSTSAQEKIKEKTDKACGIAHEKFQKEGITSTNPFIIQDTAEKLLSEHIQEICSTNHVAVIKQMAETVDTNFSQTIKEAIQAFNLNDAIDASQKKFSATTIFITWNTAFKNVLAQQETFQKSILETAEKVLSKNHISEAQKIELLNALKSSQKIKYENVQAVIIEKFTQGASGLQSVHVKEQIWAASREGNLHQRTKKIQDLVREHLQKIETVRAECRNLGLNPDEVLPNNAADIVKAAYDVLPAPLGLSKQLRHTFTSAWRGLISILGLGGVSSATAGGLLLGVGGTAIAALGGATLGVGLAVVGGIAILAALGLAAKKFYDAFQEESTLEKLKNQFATDYNTYLKQNHTHSPMDTGTPLQFI